MRMASSTFQPVWTSHDMGQRSQGQRSRGASWTCGAASCPDRPAIAQAMRRGAQGLHGVWLPLWEDQDRAPSTLMSTHHCCTLAAARAAALTAPQVGVGGQHQPLRQDLGQRLQCEERSEEVVGMHKALPQRRVLEARGVAVWARSGSVERSHGTCHMCVCEARAQPSSRPIHCPCMLPLYRMVMRTCPKPG